MENGYIKFPRSILDWEWWTEPTTSHLYITLMAMANFRDKKWHGEVIKRGELVTSYSSLSEKTGLTVQQVRTSIKKLEKSGDITKKSSNKNTLIIVTNYDLWQGEQQTNNNQITNEQQTNNNQITTTKNDKNIKNDKNNKNIKDIYLSEQLEIAPTESFITLDLKTGDNFPVYEKDVKGWQMTYPDVDVVCELRKMKSWLEANPKRRKTRIGMKRFINGWLSREQDKKDEQKGDFAF